MVSIHLLLIDKEYQEKLAEKLAMHNQIKEIHCHQTEAEYRPDLSQKELWLISKEYGQVGEGNVLWMTESPTGEEGECFCYQPFVQIQKQITCSLYRYGLVEAGGSSPEQKVIYLYSPFGGIGVSTLAYQLAEEVAKREKVLLLSLDAYHIFIKEFIPFRLSDLIFYRETAGQVNIGDFCYHQGNLDILHGPHCPEDLAIMRKQDKGDFLKMLRQSDYQTVVVDVSSSNMLDWIKPTESNESLLVVKRMADKWKQFTVSADFEYQTIEEENAANRIKQCILGGAYVNEVLPPNRR